VTISSILPFHRTRKLHSYHRRVETWDSIRTDLHQRLTDASNSVKADNEKRQNFLIQLYNGYRLLRTVQFSGTLFEARDKTIELMSKQPICTRGRLESY